MDYNKKKPNKAKKCVSVTGLNIILGRVGLHLLFLIIFFLEKNKIVCILKGISPFKMHKIIFISRKPEKHLGFASRFR